MATTEQQFTFGMCVQYAKRIFIGREGKLAFSHTSISIELANEFGLKPVVIACGFIHGVQHNYIEVFTHPEEFNPAEFIGRCWSSHLFRGAPDSVVLQKSTLTLMPGLDDAIISAGFELEIVKQDRSAPGKFADAQQQAIQALNGSFYKQGPAKNVAEITRNLSLESRSYLGMATEKNKLFAEAYANSAPRNIPLIRYDSSLSSSVFQLASSQSGINKGHNMIFEEMSDRGHLFLEPGFDEPSVVPDPNIPLGYSEENDQSLMVAGTINTYPGGPMGLLKSCGLERHAKELKQYLGGRLPKPPYKVGALAALIMHPLDGDGNGHYDSSLFPFGLLEISDKHHVAAPLGRYIDESASVLFEFDTSDHNWRYFIGIPDFKYSTPFFVRVSCDADVQKTFQRKYSNSISVPKHPHPGLSTSVPTYYDIVQDDMRNLYEIARHYSKHCEQYSFGIMHRHEDTLAALSSRIEQCLQRYNNFSDLDTCRDFYDSKFDPDSLSYPKRDKFKSSFNVKLSDWSSLSGVEIGWAQDMLAELNQDDPDLLTEQELAALASSKVPSKQRVFLRGQGIHCGKRADGSIAVLASHVEATTRKSKSMLQGLAR
jgi:hypothetical protein